MPTYVVATRSILSLFLCAVAHTATLPIRSYTVAQGLAHDHVNRIYRDSHDFLWICTDEGLSRFDGYRFLNYTVADGLGHIHVNDVIETRRGEYWIATDGGVTLFRPGDPAHRFSTYRPQGPPEALFVNSLLEETDGRLLVGTAAGLFRLRRIGDRVDFENIDFGSPPGFAEGASISTLHSNGDGSLWLGGVSGLYRRDSSGAWSRFGLKEGLAHTYVSHITTDPEGRLWVCTRQGLGRVKLSPEVGKPVFDLVVTSANGLPNDDVRTILFTGDGHRWIGTVGGLVEWLPGAPTPSNFRVYSVRHGLTDREIYGIAIGPDGNLWIGSRRGGLMCLNRTGFQSYGENDGVVLSGSDELVETPSGSICIAANSEPRRSIRCFDGGRFNAVLPRLPDDVIQSPVVAIHSTIVDHTGEWWMSSSRGVLRYAGLRSDPGAPQGAPELRLLSDRVSRRLYEDSNGDVWIATWASGLFGLMRWQRETSSIHEWRDPSPAIVRERATMSIVEAPLGQLWIGLGRPGGLLRWRGSRFEEIAGAPAGNIQSLFRDHSNRLWIASAEAGLGRIDNPTGERVAVRVYSRADGLSSSEVWTIAEDKLGRIYIGNARGVDRLDPATDRITHYSSADGLSPGDIRASLCSRTGDLWFLSNHGLSRLHPAEEPQPDRRDVRITGIRVAGAVLPISELGQANVSAAEFGWNRTSIEVDFSTVAFRSPEGLLYQFRLEGAAREWSEPSVNSTVYFSNLAPGRYRFLVRAANSERAPATFAFSISPPPWRRWWFQGGAAALILGVGYLGHRTRLDRQLALERVRSRIATDLHDDIGASLSRIAVISEALKHRVSPADGDSQRMLAEMAENSRLLVDGMSDIVWSIDPRRDHLRDVVARLRAFGSDVLEPRGIRWTCEGPSDTMDRSLSPDQRRELYLIFKEAIHNIARHSHAQNVSLRVSIENNYLRANLQDDGRGVPAGIERGLGISSMRARAERLRGKFVIETRPEGGTQAAVEFPLNA